MLFHDRDIAIVGCARTGNARNSGRSTSSLAAEALEQLLQRTGVSRQQIDGFASTLAMADCSNPFWSNLLLENLGLSVSWCQVTDIGGASTLANVVRASAAIRAGLCNIAVCVAADSVSSIDRSQQVGHRTEFADPLGYAGPLTAFGLLSTAYADRHGGLPEMALGQLAVAQRAGALLNDDTCPQLRKPLTMEQYLASPLVSTPLRLLDCVMRCDGASAFLVMTSTMARALGMPKMVHPVAYRELSNFDPQQAVEDITQSGFTVVGPQVLQDAGWRTSDIQSFHPYDDFLIAVLMQLEQIGFCRQGEAARFMADRDIGFAGDFPINPGGGQISSGQPGLAGGGVNLSEALIQMFEEAGERQVKRMDNAMVTGIGVIQYARNWGTSSAMLLERA
jgi:acetyl-CoA acetyltransferase